MKKKLYHEGLASAGDYQLINRSATHSCRIGSFILGLGFSTSLVAATLDLVARPGSTIAEGDTAVTVVARLAQAQAGSDCPSGTNGVTYNLQVTTAAVGGTADINDFSGLPATGSALRQYSSSESVNLSIPLRFNILADNLAESDETIVVDFDNIDLNVECQGAGFSQNVIVPVNTSGPTTFTIIDDDTGANLPPTAVITAQGTTTIPAGGTVSFSGNSSTDPESGALSYSWTFAGGSPATSTAANPGAITFSDPGPHNVTLTVTDNQGLTATTTTTVTVQTTANQSPDTQITSPTGSPAITVGSSLNFSGSGNDPEGDALIFLWDFQGGSPMSSNEQNPQNIVFNTPGTFIITLTAIDAQGNADPTPATLTLMVSQPAGSPVAGVLQNLATTEPQRQLANTIEIVCPQGVVSPDLQRDCNNVVGSALATDPTGASQAANALAQLTPDQVTAPLDAAQTSINAQLTNVGSRLSALRLGARGFNIAGLNVNYGDQSLSGTQLSALYDDLGSGGSAGEGDVATFGRLGIFINGNLGFGEKDSTANEEGFDIDTQGLTLGADYRLSDNLVFGGALGYMNSEIDLDQNGGDLDSDGYSLTLYGTYYQSDVFYIDGSLSYGRNDYDQARTIQYTLTQPTPVTVDQTLSADYDGNQWGATLGAGYEFNQGALNFGPTARLEYLDVELDSYRESASNPDADGSGWTVAIDDQDFESLTMSLGGQATYALSFPWGVMIPQLTFEWVHEFEDDSRIVTGRFLGDPTQQTFQLPSDADDSNYFNLGLGASFLFTGGRTGYIYVRSVQGYEDLDYTTVGAGFRLEF